MHKQETGRIGWWRRGSFILGLLVCLGRGNTHAMLLDDEETLRFNGRIYNRNVWATQAAADNTRLQTPYQSWNLLQSRTFLQLEVRHNLTDLIAGRSTGLLAPLHPLLAPLQLLHADDIDYFLSYRGEYDGVWDYGPAVFQERFVRNIAGEKLDTRQRLRHRHRLFEAYLDYTKGPLFIRLGRQNLSWGETDVFRLLDQINPLDASFGGFLVPLDERRVPLDMARVVYGLGRQGPFSELDLEGYVALDNKVAEAVPTGSPWATPNPPSIDTFVKKPARNFTDARGGGRIFGVLGNFTVSVAHYYTTLDTPTLRVVTPTRANTPPINLGEFEAAVAHGQTDQFLVEHFHANQWFKKIQISGATLSSSLPSLSAVVRSEIAYFYKEPFFRNFAAGQLLGPVQTGRLTPGYKQVGTDPISGQALVRYKNSIGRSDVVRWSFGVDVNRYIRLLNPQQPFFLSGQFFATHIMDFDHTSVATVAKSFGFAQFALPVYNPRRQNQTFVTLPQHQFINTLLVSTAYRSGSVAPALVFLYDWQGAWLVQPGITFQRDPFRYTVQYNYIGGQFKGIGFLRDRGNVLFQLEIVI